RVEYVDDDLQMNKILIQLGSDEVRLRRIADNKEIEKNQLSEILDLLESLDKFANAIRRHGGDFAEYLDKRHSGTQELPRHLVKVREGNRETTHYFHSEEDLKNFSDA